jgi:hypothetical protein
MQTKIHWRESSSGHESYSEYTLIVEYGLTSQDTLVNWFKVRCVEQIVNYPCRARNGYRLNLTHENCGAEAELIACCDRMLREEIDRARELILESHAAELALA